MGNGNGNASASAQPASAQEVAEDLRLDPDRRRKSRRQTGAVETIVADTAGNGAQSGLPTAGDDGSVTMTFYSVSSLARALSYASMQGLTSPTDQRRWCWSPRCCNRPYLWWH